MGVDFISEICGDYTTDPMSSDILSHKTDVFSMEQPVLELGNLNELEVLNLLEDQGVMADMPLLGLHEDVPGLFLYTLLDKHIYT